MLIGLMATILLSATFGVSTRTSDGDRLLYFPSVFYAMFVAMLLANFVESKKNVLLLTIVFLAFQVYFLLDNQRNWNRASKYASKVLEGIADHPQRPLYIINLPSDYKGAYVFRNCLPEALLHNNIDTAGIRVVNIVRSNELLSIGRMSSPVKENGNILIGPSTSITVNNDVTSAINGEAIEKDAIILIWNNERLNEWEPR